MADHFSEEVTTRPISAIEFVDLFLGEKIADGSSRVVYKCQLDDSVVIKHEVRDGFQNIIEWKTWQAVKDTKVAKWFAPCIHISPNGLWLVQKKAQPCSRTQYPKKLPLFFTDLKYSNFGLINNKFVCFDYGTTLLFEGLQTKKIRSVQWWDEDERK